MIVKKAMFFRKFTMHAFSKSYILYPKNKKGDKSDEAVY